VVSSIAPIRHLFWETMRRMGLLLCIWTQYGIAGTIFDLPNYQGQLEEAEPDAKQFYTQYATGFGQPFIMRGYAKKMPAFTKWATDQNLRENYGKATLGQIEFAKKETRAAPADSSRMDAFLDMYNTTDCYAVSSVPKEMASDVFLPQFLNCGPATQFLDVNNMWFSSGGTKSVIHNDDQDNVNCVFSGSKRMIFFSPTNKTSVESAGLGWIIADEEREKDPEFEGYGAFNGRMDVDKFDTDTYPGWTKLPWWDAKLQPGDCVFIPTSWYHHVHSTGRSLAVNMWWWRRDDLNGIDWECSAKDSTFTYGDCSWGYEGPPDRSGVKTSPDELTSCKGKKETQGMHAESFITQWQRFPERMLIPAVEKKLGYSVGAPVETMIDMMEMYHKNRRAFIRNLKKEEEEDL